MTENYLHFIWKIKRLPFHRLKTVNGKEIHVKDVGVHNSIESGPDFLNGKVVFDGVEWCGNIEMHLKSSDWFRHGHQYDRAYDTVVLHVVYEYDCAVLIEGKEVPTIELKSMLDEEHYQRWESFSQSLSKINCSFALPEIDRIYLRSMMDRALMDRLNRKIFVLERDFVRNEPTEVLYFLLAGAFGAKVNRDPFEELTHRLPLSLLKRLHPSKQRELILRVSGLNITNDPELDGVCKQLKIDSIASHVWKRKGLRPQGRPEVRLQQFSYFTTLFDFEVSLTYLPTGELYEYLWSVVQVCNQNLNSSGKISRSFFELLMTNCVAPFLWWFGNYKNDEAIRSKAIELLYLIGPEQNAILKNWEACGVRPGNGYESQALIELYNEHCMKNKCMNCAVGTKILSRE